MKERLSDELLTKVLRRVHSVANASGINYCLIGGGLLQFLGIPGYVTEDVDIASDGQPKAGLLNELILTRGSITGGHYRVYGASVDWMLHGKPYSLDLFKEAIRTSYLFNGVWCATMNHAAAIKLWAGREKDLEIVSRLSKEGHIDLNLVRGLVSVFCRRKK